MSSSKFANLEDVDFESPDVYETRSPSPSSRSRNARSSRRHESTSSDEDDSDDDDDDEDDDDDDENSPGRKSGRKGTKKVGGGPTGRKGGEEATKHPDIVGTSLNPDEALKRFEAASGVDGRRVDFSSSIQKRKKQPQYYPPSTFETTTYALGSGSGYRTSAGGEGPGDEEPWTTITGAKEEPVDKFRRLRFEMEELEKELRKGGAESQGQVVASDAPLKKEEGGLTRDLIPQLSSLKEQLDSMEKRTTLGDSSASSSSWNVETRRLLDELAKKPGKDSISSQGGADGGVISATAGDSLTINNTGDGAKLSELDGRLAGLEELVGVRDALTDESNTLPRPLLPSLARIEHLLTLLTHPRHLDGISRRIKVLVSELERLHEARRKLAITNSTQGGIGEASTSASTSTSQSIMIPVDTMQKLDTVLPVMSKLEPLIPIVPSLLSRLHSLSTLHASSDSFAKDMSTLEASTKRSQSNNDELKAILANLEKSFAENQDRVGANLKVIEERMESVGKRIAALQ